MSNSRTDYSNRIVLYVYATLLAGAAALFWAYRYPMEMDFLTLFLFLVLATAAELLIVDIPGGYGVSVGFAVDFAALTIMGPFGGSLVAGLSVLVGEVNRVRKLTLPVVFNVGQVILACSLAGIVFEILGGVPGLRSGVSQVWIAYVGLAVVYFTVNATALTGIFSLQQRRSFWRVWITTIRWLIMNYLALAPLGVLIAVLYLGPLGIGGVALLLIPLYLARYSFQQYALIKEAHFDTIQALAAALDAKDTYTKGHSDRVAEMAVRLARKLELSEERVEKIRYAGLLHDIGKIGVHDGILNKLGRLEDRDFKLIQEHPVVGANMISQVAFLNDVAAVVRYHHEWYDGHGYPDGISGSEIPLESRIMAVADAFDAMTSDRVYRRGMSKEEAMGKILASKGGQFDPVVVDAFVSIMNGTYGGRDDAR